jgi:transposase
MEYYIYHIAGVKIGCTSDLQKRMSEQGFTEWEILETHTDGWQAGDREIELQKEYGYRVDHIHYMNTIEARREAGILQGAKNVESGHIQRLSSYRSRESYLGPRPYMKKLNQEQIDEILLDTDSLRVIATKYNVSHVTISNIKKETR